MVPPAHEAFKTPLTMDEVLARLTPFLASPPPSAAPAESMGGTSTSTGNASANT